MTRIAVLGGTGYVGTHIVREAAHRGHEVTAYSRTASDRPIDGVTYVHGSALDTAFLDRVIASGDVVIHSMSPHGELTDRLEGVMRELSARAQAAGVRLGVVGGVGTLRVSEGGAKLYELPTTPDRFKPVGKTMDAILDQMLASPEPLDWFYITPARVFGAWAEGEATGRYRTGGDVLLEDADGTSAISGADFAKAVVDEIESPQHRRKRFAVAY